MKKDRVFVFNIIYGCLLLLVCLSCRETKYGYGDKLYSRNEFLAMVKQENDAMLSQIFPTDAPVGGSLVVVIPTEEFLAKAYGPEDPESRRRTPRDQLDLQMQLLRNDQMTSVEAVRKRALFETVDWRQSVDPEQETFETDFALIRPARKDADWLLRTRRQTTQDGSPIAMGPSSASPIQRITIWLNNIEEAARKAKHQ